MAIIDENYHELLNTILKNGFKYEDPNRKGINRIQIPSYQFKHDFKDGFPAITTKKLYWKGVVGELLWFLRGDTNIKYLVDNNINIWNKDAYNYYCKVSDKTIGEKEFKYSFEEFIQHCKNTPKYPAIAGSDYKLGDVGRIYGAQWRNFTVHNVGPNDSFPIYVDQIANLIKNLKEKPLSSSHIVTAWNPAELDQMALPPCHKGFQLMVYELTTNERLHLWGNPTNTIFKESKLKNKFLNENNVPKYGFDLVWEQRSCDSFLGIPFNIASYALLAHIIGKIVNMVPGELYGDLRNVHIYEPHLDAVKEQLNRSTDVLNSRCELENFTGFKMGMHNNFNQWINSREISDFNLTEHSEQPVIKAEMLAYNK